MTPPTPTRDGNAGWFSPPVWADAFSVDENPVRQLLVPGSRFQLVGEADGKPVIENDFGRWPAFQIGSPAPAAVLAAQLPLGIGPGSTLHRASWVGPRTRLSQGDVLDGYSGALNFEGAPEGGPGALRVPQRGAVHAVLGYWTTERAEPTTVVMPTGTGKTETMLALLVAGRPRLLLVIVPSDALREQTAGKFERLGILQEQRIVAPTAMRPVVGKLLHGLKSAESAASFADACNVVVATAAVLASCTDEARAALLERCSHLFIDEAHHVAAQSWSTTRETFEGRPVVQFTATPFREDGHRVTGRQIYAFPLRLAQEQGYFSPINYTSVIDFDNLDESVARQAAAQLRHDLAAGHDHILMARVENIRRVREVLPTDGLILASTNRGSVRPAIRRRPLMRVSRSIARRFGAVTQETPARRHRCLLRMLGLGAIPDEDQCPVRRPGARRRCGPPQLLRSGGGPGASRHQSTGTSFPVIGR